MWLTNDFEAAMGDGFDRLSFAGARNSDLPTVLALINVKFFTPITSVILQVSRHDVTTRNLTSYRYSMTTIGDKRVIESRLLEGWPTQSYTNSYILYYTRRKHEYTAKWEINTKETLTVCDKVTHKKQIAYVTIR